MHLIGPLASGIAGAGNGTAEIYTRGTTQRATRYYDFEATQAVTPTSALELDSNGSAVVYVNRLVDVVVSDSNGTEIRRFVAGAEAPAVEVISQSFTGTDYSSGQRAASKPTTLQTALDGLKASFGALDFNVLFGGSSRTLQSVLAGVGGFVYNVKDSLYGATGNGTSDDTSAVQATITACNAAGGGIVFFPPGTYSLTSITLTSKVSLLGCGTTSILGLKHASNNLVSYGTVASSDRPSIEGLSLLLLQNSSGNLVDVTSTNLNLKIDNCSFGPGAYDLSGYLVREHGTTCRTWVTRSRFTTSASTPYGFRASNPAYLAMNEFYAGTTTFGVAVIDMASGIILGNLINGSTAASGAVVAISTTGATYVAGNTVLDGGGASVSIALTDSVDAGNTYASTITYSATTPSPAGALNSAFAGSAERRTRIATLSGTDDTYTCPSDTGDLILTVTTSATPVYVVLPAEMIGRRGRVIFLNTSGGNRDCQVLPASGYANGRGSGTGFVTVGNNFSYGVDWRVYRSGATTLTYIESLSGGTVFAV